MVAKKLFDNLAKRVSLKQLMMQNIEKQLRGLLWNMDSVYGPTQSTKAMIELGLQVNIRDASIHVTVYGIDVSERFEVIGEKYFETENKEHAMKIFLGHIKHPP